MKYIMKYKKTLLVLVGIAILVGAQYLGIISVDEARTLVEELM